MQPTDATLDVCHPIYDTMSGIFTRLLRPKKNKPQRDEFEELEQLLTMEHGSLRERQLTRSQMQCAFTVLDTFLTRVQVRTNVVVDLRTVHRAIWPHRTGLVLPPAFSPCALQYHVPQQVPQDILVCCEQLVAQMTIQERLAIRGRGLLVQVDATTATDDIPIRLGTCFLGRYHLRAMVFSVAGEWSCLVPGVLSMAMQLGLNVGFLRLKRTKLRNGCYRQDQRQCLYWRRHASSKAWTSMHMMEIAGCTISRHMVRQQTVKAPQFKTTMMLTVTTRIHYRLQIRLCLVMSSQLLTMSRHNSPMILRHKAVIVVRLMRMTF